MTAFERRQRLVGLLRQQPGLRVPEIASILDVSEGTVRNDLNALESLGQLQRVRGGAVLQEDFPARSPSFSVRSRKNAAAKLIMARWAADLVEDGDSILLDASTTVFTMARFLQNRRKLRVVTNGIEVARALAQNLTNTVILLGGVLNPDGASLTGPISEQILAGLHIQTAFVSCSGFTQDAGLTEVHINEAQLKRGALRSTHQMVALVDSSKFGKVDLTPFARLDQISHLFTDKSISPDWIACLKGQCLTFHVCDEDSVATYTPCDQETRHFRIGFANQSERLPFAVEVRRSLERAAKAAGNVDLVLADNQLNPQAALTIAERFLQENLDLVIEYQIDEATGNRMMSRFREAGLPVIAVDIPMVGATFFGVDNYRAGYLAGEALGEWVQREWQGRLDSLMILDEPRAGALPAARIQGQLDGFCSVYGPVPVEKQRVIHSGNQAGVSEKGMAAALKELPDARQIAVVSFNDEAALGALQAARHLKREQDVVIVGQGAERRVRDELLRPGTRLIGSTAYSPEKYGELLISLALKILRGERVPPAVYMEHSFIRAASQADAISAQESRLETGD